MHRIAMSRLAAVLGALLLGTAALTHAEAESSGERYTRTVVSADGIGKRYIGREIAGVMGWQGAAWLEREEREREERTDLLLDALQLKPGMVVADIGAGTGYLARRMAPAVMPGGRVLAVDAQPEMLRIHADHGAAKRSGADPAFAGRRGRREVAGFFGGPRHHG